MNSIPKKIIQKYTQTVGERNEIDEILEPVLLMQKIYGLQILEPKWSWKKYGIYRVINFALCFYVTLGTIEVCTNTTDFNIIIEGIFTMLVNVEMFFKILLFASQRKRCQEIYIKAKYILSLMEKFPLKRDQILKKLKLLVILMLLSVMVPVGSYLLIALWNAFNGNRVTLSRSTSSLMPMTSPYFELGLLIHLYYLLEAAFCLLVVDFWYIFMCFFFFEANDILIRMLEVQKNEDRDLYAKKLDESLREFYILQVEVMKYLNLINGIFKWISMVPITAILIQTSLFLMIFKEEINLQLGAVMLPASGELITYNWFGEKVCSTGEQLSMALLHFDWTRMNLRDQKKYYIMACYMNKKIGVVTAFGYDLSLLTLSSIYKMSYQMFTVFSAT